MNESKSFAAASFSSSSFSWIFNKNFRFDFISYHVVVHVHLTVIFALDLYSHFFLRMSHKFSECFISKFFSSTVWEAKKKVVENQKLLLQFGEWCENSYANKSFDWQWKQQQQKKRKIMRRVGNKQAAPTATQNVKIDIDIETQNIQNQIKLHWMEYDTKCFKECAKMFVENFAATEVTEHWHGTCVCMRRGIHLHSRFFFSLRN